MHAALAVSAIVAKEGWLVVCHAHGILRHSTLAARGPTGGRRLYVWTRARTPAVRILLWEVHRLRALVLRANDFVRIAAYHRLDRHMDTTSRTLFEGLRESLKDEPVVKEDEARRVR